MLRDIFMLALFSVLFCSCGNEAQITIKTNNPYIEHKEGVFLYNKKEFTGFLLAYNSGGDTQSLERYNGGKRSGESRYWYDNGLLREIANYKLGKKHGGQIGYWLNGTIRFKHQFLLDSLNGNQMDWTDRGILWRDVNFNNGKEVGWQRIYTENGKLRNNYQVINGRRYGMLQGEKCDSIEFKIQKK